METKNKIVLSVTFGWALLVTMVYGWQWWHKPSYRLETARITSNIAPLAIIGSGPAGLSAALYGARLGLPTILFAGPEPGGQLTETGVVENWPGAGARPGRDIMDTAREQAEKAGARILHATIKSVDLAHWPFTLQTDDNQTINALALVIATGSASRVLDVPGERQYFGKGVTTCALCDAPYYRGKDVVVVGGGDSALTEAIELAPYARSITILVRGPKLRATKTMHQRTDLIPSIKIRTNTAITAIEGDGSWVTSIKLNNGETLAIAGVFLAIGHEPRTKLFTALERDKGGYLHLVGRSQRTSLPGVYAAGDVADAHYRQASVASGSGVQAAIEAFEWLQEIGYGTIEKDIKAHVYEPPYTGPSHVKNVTSVAEFERETRGKTAVLDFYTQQCPSCAHMMPTFEWVAHQLHEKAVFIKIDAHAVPALAKKFEVQLVPTFVVVHNDTAITRASEVMDKAQMRAFIEKAL